MAVHRHARSFDRVAEAYERGRPLFPAAAVECVVTALGLRPGRTVLDIAAGTGKLTRLLLASGADVVAVEPVAGMREVFARQVPDVTILDGTAEALPLPDHSVDAVTVAQAFHWFDPGPALSEMDRVLATGGAGTEGGRVALLWNVRDDTSPIEAAATEIVDRHRAGAPGHQTMDLGATIAASVFTETDLREWPWTVAVDEATFVDRFLSVSFVASLGPSASADLAAALKAVFAEHAHDGTVQHAYTCRCHILERRG